MVGVGRYLQRLSGPSLLHKHGHLEQVARDHALMAFKNLQEKRLHNLSGQPLPVLRHPQY